jgi:hypothetical protein
MTSSTSLFSKAAKLQMKAAFGRMQYWSTKNQLEMRRSCLEIVK